MQKGQLFFEVSPWLILPCLLLGLAYAYFLYQKKGPWSTRTNYLLAFLRFSLATVLSILLLAPLIALVKNTFIPPLYVVAIDNSQSVANVQHPTELLKQLPLLNQRLENRNHEIIYRTFDNKNLSAIQELRFDFPYTDIHSFFQSIISDYEGRNLSGIVFISDGIYNRGISPEYTTFNVPIYAVGLGDTLPQIDINLKNLYYNKIAYEGNKFPIVAEIQHFGFTGDEVTISIIKDGKTIASANTALGEEGELQQIEFLIDAEHRGLQHYTIRVDSLPGEFATSNNEQQAFIDIIEGREKVLLAAAVPHPDIKAIYAALEANSNYETTLYIPSINEAPITPTELNQYDVLILHQIPFKGGGIGNNLFELLLDNALPKWLILGNQSDIDQFNSSNGTLQIQASGSEKDQVFPSFSTSFQLFKTDEKLYDALTSFPVLTVPFGSYHLAPETAVLFQQKVGAIVTEKPLFIFGRQENQKQAVLAGEGIWKWRMQEFARSNTVKSFDELVSKTVQYLSAKEDKRKFRVYTIQNEFTDTEPVVFETEVYNSLFEPIFDQTIQLQISSSTGEQSSYSYTTTPSNTTFQISGLPEGVYQYRAESTLDGKKVSSEGEFSIAELQLESLSLTANHHLLRKLGRNSGGNFYLPNQFHELIQDLQDKEAKSIIFSEEEFRPVINLSWVLAVLIALVTLEWFLRKYNGSY